MERFCVSALFFHLVQIRVLAGRFVLHLSYFLMELFVSNMRAVPMRVLSFLVLQLKVWRDFTFGLGFGGLSCSFCGVPLSHDLFKTC